MEIICFDKYLETAILLSIGMPKAYLFTIQNFLTNPGDDN